MEADQLWRDGYAVLRDAIPEDLIVRTAQAFESADMSRSKRGSDTFGARNILDIAEVGALAALPAVQGFVRSVLDGTPMVVRGIFFDKTPGANWPVAWHQDLSLALAEKHDVEGWQAWSIKAGVAHVQPPAALLERMVTLRFHLDDCGEESGPLRVAPGSHARGRLDRDQQSALRANETACCVAAGDIITMRPLILHASSAAVRPTHRRVVHLEFAPDDLLPAPLRWHSSISV